MSSSLGWWAKRYILCAVPSFWKFCCPSTNCIFMQNTESSCNNFWAVYALRECLALFKKVMFLRQLESVIVRWILIIILTYCLYTLIQVLSLTISRTVYNWATVLCGRDEHLAKKKKAINEMRHILFFICVVLLTCVSSSNTVYYLYRRHFCSLPRKYPKKSFFVLIFCNIQLNVRGENFLSDAGESHVYVNNKWWCGEHLL